MSSPALAEPQPGSKSETEALQVIKRNGSLVDFNPSKISVAVTKAFLAVEGDQAAGSARINSAVQEVTSQVVRAISRRLKAGGKVHIEDIQDQVELALMRAGEQKVARAYVLYREEHARQRALDEPVEAHPHLTVKKADGSIAPLDLGLMKQQVEQAATGLDGIDGESLVDDALRNLFDGIEETDVLSALIMTARGRIEREPDYSAVTARLLLEQLRLENARALDLSTELPLAELYPQALSAFIHAGIRYELLDDALAAFDLEVLGHALKPERDHQFGFLGLQTLYDRYFLHWNKARLELPQVFFMRVAMGLALREDDPNGRAIEFYELLSSFDYMASTPTLFNSGTRHSQLSSCYLTTVDDDLEGIYGAIRDNAMLSKWAGGTRTRLPHQRHQRRKPGRGAIPEGGERHRRGREPGRQAQGCRVRLPGKLAPGHRGIPGTAQEHRRRTPPHPRHEHRQLGAGPVDRTHARRRRLDPVFPQRRAGSARPDR